MSRFTALQNFEAPELQSAYAQGLSYTIRPPEAVAASLRGQPEAVIKAAVERAYKLPALVARWVAEGKVMMGGAEAEVAALGGPAAPGDAGQPPAGGAGEG